MNYFFLFFFSYISYNNEKNSLLPFKNLETIQFINNCKNNNQPLKIFIFFILNKEFLDYLSNLSNEDIFTILKDVEYYSYHYRFALLLPIELVHLPYSEVSRKILIHHNNKSLVGLGIIVVSFDGTFLLTSFIPSKRYSNLNVTNLLFIINDNDILIKEGILSIWQKIKILYLKNNNKKN